MTKKQKEKLVEGFLEEHPEARCQAFEQKTRIFCQTNQVVTKRDICTLYFGFWSATGSDTP